MICFNSDYIEGATPEIIDELVKTNMEQTTGYSEDKYCTIAKEQVKVVCGFPSDNGKSPIDVHFLVGGTQTNTTVIASALRPHQGVISAKTGHINVHETGAIESTGHKVLAIDSECPECRAKGKLLASDIETAITAHYNDPNFEHMVQPGMVYISNPTENGAIYTKTELTDISNVCHKHNVYLYVDGARLGYGLASPKNDLSLNDFAKLCDAFYIGGTKIGALFGEAVVISNDKLKPDFRYFIKQHGGLFAKGRLLGIQFYTLFRDANSFDKTLYGRISQNAINQSQKIASALKKANIEFASEPETNQLFPILSDRIYNTLAKDFVFEIWTKLDGGKQVVRICTSWGTTDENCQKLVKAIQKLN